MTVLMEAASPRRRGVTLGLCAALLLSACGTTSSPTVGSVAPTQSRLGALAAQLRSDLHGTPVVVDMLMDDSVLRLAVPREHCFDTGRAVVKPALGAVLARLVPSLKANPRWALRIAGPLDGAGRNNLLALDRGSAARDYLVARGVLPQQFLPAVVAEGPVLELRLAASSLALGPTPAPAR